MQRLRSRQIAAGIVISLVTVAVIGVLLVATTPLGCGPAKALGLKSVTKHCVSTQAVAARPSPSPTPFFEPTPIPAPYTPPASPPYPPYNPGASSSSPAFPPYFAPSSGSGVTTPPLALNCRLAVYAGPPGSGGFIVFPAANFITDSSSGVTLPSPSPGSASPPPQAPGYGQGYPGLTYDAPFKKWLPVPWAWVTPDGTHYAYASPSSIYVVNVADGTQVELGEGKVWSIISAQPEGVYAINPNLAGLWLLPYTGAAREITTAGYWQVEGAGAAYGTETSAVPQGVTNSIIKLDVKTGTSTVWFTRAGESSSVAGVDGNGNPIILTYPFNGPGPEVWIATSATEALAITGPSVGIFAQAPPVPDSHGVWFAASVQDYSGGGGSGQILYVPGSGVYLMTRIGGQLAGGCS